jgi:hypothetical protein
MLAALVALGHSASVYTIIEPCARANPVSARRAATRACGANPKP